MEEEDDMIVEGLDEEAINEIMGEDQEEGDEEEQMGYHRKKAVEQNDYLLEYKFKDFLKSCNPENEKSFSVNFKADFFRKSEPSAKALDPQVQELIEMDMPELEKLIQNLKNCIMSMRVKVAEIIDAIRSSEESPKEAISLVNLRVEILTEYWSYILLLALYRVGF